MLIWSPLCHATFRDFYFCISSNRLSPNLCILCMQGLQGKRDSCSSNIFLTCRALPAPPHTFFIFLCPSSPLIPSRATGSYLSGQIHYPFTGFRLPKKQTTKTNKQKRQPKHFGFSSPIHSGLVPVNLIPTI